MKDNYDFSKGIKNPYKFSEDEKRKAIIEYLFKKSKKTKADFKKEIDAILA